MTATKEMGKVDSAAGALEKINAAAMLPNDSVRNVPELAAHKGIRQGDVYVVRLPDNTPYGKPRGSRQVAVGNTIGARHIAEGEAVKVFESEGYTPPQGQQIVQFAIGPIVKSEKRWCLTHPEHADFNLPEGCYQVLYQQDPVRQAAVAD